MMAVEFMTGATLFALINLVFFLFIMFLSVVGLKKVYTNWKNPDEQLLVPTELFFASIFFILFVFFGGVTQPKLSLDPVQNRDLIEYQSETPAIVIETPPPRTEQLPGFQPLKKD